MASAIRVSFVLLIAIGCGPTDASKAPQMQPADAGAPKVARPEPRRDDGAGVEADDAAGSQTPRVVLDAWGDFPKDVFFEDPFAELGEEPAPNAAPEVSRHIVKNHVTPTTAETGEATFEQQKDHAAEKVAWAELISAEDLRTETSEILQRLATRFGSVAEYNANYRAIRVEASVLAVLAGIAAQHEGSIPWKPQATRVRDAAAGLVDSVGGLGDRYFTPAGSQYTRVRSLMDGRVANDEPGPNVIVDVPWSNVADRSPLMHRMKLAQDERIKPLTASEGEFRRNSRLIVREAALLAALAEVISTSYDFCDDEVYQTYSRRLRDQSRQLSQAAREFDFRRAADLAGANLKTCNQCHAEFRFGDFEF